MNKNISILWLIPSKKNSPLDMLFAKRGIPFLQKNGINVIIRHFYQSKSIFGAFKEILYLRKYSADNHIDLIHAQFGSTTSLVAMMTGVPFLITFRGTDLNGDPSSSKIINILRIGMGVLAAHFAKSVICVSSGLKLALGPNGHRAVVIPDGTEVELFMPMDKTQAREQLGVAQDKFYIAFASGGRRKVKGFDQAEEVRIELTRRGYDIEILEIWDIPHEKVPLYINASDTVILTSEREGSPNIVREALACGVPVVSFDVGDVIDWVKLDKFSSIVPNRSTNLMADRVEEILKSFPRRERRVDVNLYSEENSAKKLLEIYKSIH